MEFPDFGVRLKDARLTLGLSLRQVAARSGVNLAHLSEYERGLRPASRLSWTTLWILAGVLHTTPHRLGAWDELVWVHASPL